MKKFVKVCLIALTLVSVLQFSPFLLTKQAGAETLLETVNNGGLKTIGTDAYNTPDAPQDIRDIIVGVIRVLLGFLGIIFVGLALYSGFTWMTAGGDEAKIKEAQKRIQAAVIGLVIILSTWGVTMFVFNSIIKAATLKK